MAEKITPKYIPYSSQQVTALLKEVEDTTVATESEVRDIVRNYNPTNNS